MTKQLPSDQKKRNETAFCKFPVLENPVSYGMRPARLERFNADFRTYPCCCCGAVFPANAQVNVTQYHNSSKRDGLYIDSAFTQSAAANLTRDMNFDGTIVGNVYAQPLYIEGGPSGRLSLR